MQELEKPISTDGGIIDLCGKIALAARGKKSLVIRVEHRSHENPRIIATCHRGRVQVVDCPPSCWTEVVVTFRLLAELHLSVAQKTKVQRGHVLFSRLGVEPFSRQIVIGYSGGHRPRPTKITLSAPRAA